MDTFIVPIESVLFNRYTDDLQEVAKRLRDEKTIFTEILNLLAGNCIDVKCEQYPNLVFKICHLQRKLTCEDNEKNVAIALCPFQGCCAIPQIHELTCEAHFKSFSDIMGQRVTTGQQSTAQHVSSFPSQNDFGICKIERTDDWMSSESNVHDNSRMQHTESNTRNPGPSGTGRTLNPKRPRLETSAIAEVVDLTGSDNDDSGCTNERQIHHKELTDKGSTGKDGEQSSSESPDIFTLQNTKVTQFPTYT